MSLGNFVYDYFSILFLIWDNLSLLVKVTCLIIFIYSILIIILNKINLKNNRNLNPDLKNLLKVELELLELREKYENNDISYNEYLTKSRFTVSKRVI